MAAFYKLKDRFLLRGWDRLPNAVVDTHTHQTGFVNAVTMEALKLCTGTIDVELPFVPEKLRRAIPDLVDFGLIEPCGRGDAIRDEQRYAVYPNRYIKMAHWSVTGRCNFRCRHCFMEAPEGAHGELEHESVLDIARQIGDCGIQEVSLTGGEPLIRKDFFDIVDALLERGVGISSVFTNGALVTESLLLQFEERGIRPEFNMSYDGADCHDWMRGVSGAEKMVERAFKLCREHGFPTSAELCLHAGNADRLRESINRLASWGCQALKVGPVMDAGEWAKNGTEGALTWAEVYRICLDYIPHYFEDGAPLSLMLPGVFMADREDPCSWRVASMKECGNPAKTCVCGHARTVAYISPEGRVMPCMQLTARAFQERFPLIGEVGLPQCITDSAYMDVVTATLADYLDHNPGCRECEHALACGSGCRATALDTTPDDFFGVDEGTCELFRGGWIPKVQAVAGEAVKRWGDRLPKGHVPTIVDAFQMNDDPARTRV